MIEFPNVPCWEVEHWSPGEFHSQAIHLRAKDVFARVPGRASNLNYPNTMVGKQNHFDESAAESTKVTIPNAPAPQIRISWHLNRNNSRADSPVDYRDHLRTMHVL